MKSRCIYWLKRDFRLRDNPALTGALRRYDTVVPVFILEPSAVAAPETSVFHLHAQSDAFNGLCSQLRKHEECPISAPGFAHAEVIPTLEALYAAAPFTHLVSHQEIGGNRTYDRDKVVAKWCRGRGVQWEEVQQTGVFRGKVDRDRRHRDWESFYTEEALPEPTNLYKLTIPKVYRELLAVPAFGGNAAPTEDLATDPWMHTNHLFGDYAEGPLHPSHFGESLSGEQLAYVQPVNEAAAQATLQSFLTERGLDYSKGMSSPNSAFYRCSRLSVHLAWGTISGRLVHQLTKHRMEELKESDHPQAGTWRKNLRSFLSRLHWRDHFTQRLETEVEMEHRPLNPNFWDLELENDPKLLKAWLTGQTGFPMVDACIRCMKTTGYINFRMRAMLTSTAAHMLHLDFRSIDKPMARMYTDYHPGIHLAQLQMQAGMVGINTLRTYSPEKQILDQDPDCVFIHRWIPELRPYSAREIIKRNLTQGLGDYPPAVVDRTERVKAYRKIIGDLKFRAGGRELTEAVYQKHGSRKRPARRKKASQKSNA